MIVSLNRWEWNRALFFGLIVLIAEVGLATALILRKLGHLEHGSGADPATLATLRSTRPPSPDRFEWLKDSARGQGLNVFITFLVAGGVLLSGVAWVVDQLGSKTSTPIGERAPGGEAGPDQLPGRRPGRRRRHRPRPGHPRRRRRADPQAPGPLRPRSRGDHARRAWRSAPWAWPSACSGRSPCARRPCRRTRRSSPARPSTWSCPPAPRAREEARRSRRWCEALLLSCRLEVHSDLASPIRDEGGGRFRVTLVPAPDETDRRQLRGCLEDWTIDAPLGRRGRVRGTR